MKERIIKFLNIFKNKRNKLTDFNEFGETEKDYKKTISFFILIGIISIEILYFSYKYYQIQSHKKELELLISGDEAYLEQLKNSAQSAEKLTSVEKQELEEKHANKEYIIGAKIDNIEIIEKITKKHSNKKFFMVKLYYTAESIDALKDLIVLKYIDPSIYKIVDVSDKYIKVIIKED